MRQEIDGRHIRESGCQGNGEWQFTATDSPDAFPKSGLPDCQSGRHAGLRNA